MGNIFINTLSIKNLKCFEVAELNFSVPDGKTEGSGLNILIGENGTGKTTILEAINNVTQNAFSVSSRVDIKHFRDVTEEIIIGIETNEFHCKMPPEYRKNYFESNGVELTIKTRARRTPGKILSQPFVVNSIFRNKYNEYRSSKGEFVKPIADYHRKFEDEKIIGDAFNTFYFDKGRTRQLISGTYKTTYDRICDDLNWKFVKNINDENKGNYLESVDGEYFKTLQEIANTTAGATIANELKEFLDDGKYGNLKIEFVNILNPYTNSFFAVRNDGELNQTKPKDLGSGVEMILSLLLLRSIANASNGTVIYLIDEPELHLHPRAQDRLFELLLEESKNKQIFISTHSPYLFKNSLNKKIGINILTKNDDGTIEIENATSRSWGQLPWSPSWGEINYYAYNIPTIELHNELYGYIQDYHGKYTVNDMDDYLEAHGVQRNRVWIRIRNGNPQNPEPITICSYIRNAIHHPENKLNNEFTMEELKTSIETLNSII